MICPLPCAERAACASDECSVPKKCLANIYIYIIIKAHFNSILYNYLKAAELHIEAGGTLVNNGSLIAYGGLYNLGTLINNGHYNDTITSNNPDKGQFTYHKGIQVAWKDDVTQSGVRMGYFSNGEAGNPNTSFINNGDLVLAPGFLENYGTLENTANGNMYLCSVDEAVIPVQVSWSALIMEQRIGFERPMAVYFTNYAGASLANAGNIASADVEIVGNGNLGNLIQVVPEDLAYDICVDNFGQFSNSGSISLNGLYNFAGMTNSGSIANKIVLQGNGDTPKAAHTIIANQDNTVTSPDMPWMNGNVGYHFQLLDGLFSTSAEVTVKVTSSGITFPVAIKDLVYNGKEQTLITSGATTDGQIPLHR